MNCCLVINLYWALKNIYPNLTAQNFVSFNFYFETLNVFQSSFMCNKQKLKKQIRHRLSTDYRVNSMISKDSRKTSHSPLNKVGPNVHWSIASNQPVWQPRPQLPTDWKHYGKVWNPWFSYEVDQLVSEAADCILPWCKHQIACKLMLFDPVPDSKGTWIKAGEIFSANGFPCFRESILSIRFLFSCFNNFFPC